jgi:hypothetical protein
MEDTIQQLRDQLERGIRTQEETKNALVPIRRIVVRRED